MATYYIDFEHTSNTGDGLSYANRKNSYDNLSLSAGDEVRIKKSPDPTSLGNGAVVRDYSNQSYNPGSLSASNVVFSTTTGQTKINLDAYVGTNSGTRNNNGYTWQTGDKILIFMCNFPEGKNINGVWEIELEGSNSDYVYLKGFTASNANSESGNTMRYLSVTTETIKLASWPCKEIASSKGGRSAWTASSGVTTTLKGDGTVDSSWSAWNSRYDWIHPTGSDSISIPSGHSGKVAYYATGDLNLSAYQQISCLIQFRSTPGNYDVGQAGQVFSLRLCTDTSGDTSVHTIPIQNIGSFYQYGFVPYVYDLGTNLNTSIKSIALYADSTTSTTHLLRFNNIVACKASSSADSLTHNSLIGLNTTADRAWFPVLHLTDNQNLLTLLTFHRSYGNNGLGYYGNYMGVTWSQTSSATTIYKREPIRPKWLIDYTSSSSSHHDFSGNGTEGNYITISGGWDDTNMSSSPSGSKTFIRGNGNGYGLRTQSKSYIDISKIHTTGFYYNILTSNNGAKYRDLGFSDVGQSNQIGGTNILEANIEYATSARVRGIYLSGFRSPNANISDINFYYCRSGSLGSNHCYIDSQSQGNIGLIDFSLAPFQSYGMYFSFQSNPMTINRVKGGGTRGEYLIYFPDNVSNITINNVDMDRTYYGLYFNTLFGNIIVKNITHSIEFDFATFYSSSYYFRYVNHSDHRFQSNHSIRMGGGNHTGLIDGGTLLKEIYSLDGNATLKVKNVVLPTSGSQVNLNGNAKVLFKNYNNVSGDDRNVYNNGELRPESTIRHTSSGVSWRLVSSQYSTLTNIPLIIDLGKVIVNSGSLVTVAIWTYKTASGATGFLRVAQNTDLGMTSYAQADTSSNSLNTWVKITTTFTPSASGLATIQIGGYGSQSTEYVYFDDLEVSQA